MKKVFLTTLMAVLCLVVTAQTPITITASNGNEGDYTIFSGTSGNAASSLSDIDKPIILAEGFDMLDEISGFDIGVSLSQKSNNYLGQQLLDDGYDIVILNFKNPLDRLDDNAQLLIKLINETNLNKQGSEQLIVGGVSMGGLIARYALTWMEANNQAHNASLYISLDVPHKGANIPSSLHWALKDAGTNTFIPLAVALKNALGSEAAKQMLSVQPSSFAPNPMFTNFFNDLKNLNGIGYPQNCKKIAIANGSRVGTKNTFDQLVNCQNLSGVYPAGQNTIAIIGVDIEATMAPSHRDNPPLPPNTTIELARTHLSFVFGHKHYVLGGLGIIEGEDYAPGGRNSLLCKEVIETLQTYNSNPDAVFEYADHFTFIPTISALDISTDNLFTNIQSNENYICGTPFDAYYVPIENQEHIEITPISSNWLYDQIKAVSQNNTITIPSLETFNFGGNTNYYIHNNYLIEANATFKINGSGNTDYFAKNVISGNSSSAPATPSNSDFTISTTDCGTTQTIEVETDGVLELGDNTGRTATLVIKTGDVLILGGLLKINDGSKLILEDGAKLIANQGNTIELNGSNAILEFQRGVLELNAGAKFEPSGTGFVRFANLGATIPLFPQLSIISKGANTEVIFQRSSREKLLELGDDYDLIVDHSLNLFKMEGITAELGSNSGIKLASKFHVVNNLITKNPAIAGDFVHYGITVNYLKQPTWITDNSFEFAKTGLKLVNSAIYDAKIHFNDFTTCETGINVLNARSHFGGNSFNNCRFDVTGYALRNTLRFESNLFNHTGTGVLREGVNLTGASYPYVGLAGNVFKGSTSAFFAADLNSTLKCNYFLDNESSVWADRTGRLNISNDEVSLDVQLTTGALLTGGNNYFKIDRSGVMLVDFNANFPSDNATNGYNTFDITSTNPLGSNSYMTLRYNNVIISPNYTIDNNSWLPVPPVNINDPNIIEANFGPLNHFNIQESVSPTFIYGQQAAPTATCPIADWNDAISDPQNFDPKTKNIRIEGSSGNNNGPFVFSGGRFGGVTGNVPSGTYSGTSILASFGQVLNGLLVSTVVDGTTKYKVDAAQLLNLSDLLTNTYALSTSDPAMQELHEHAYKAYIFYLSESEIQDIYEGNQSSVDAQIAAATNLFSTIHTVNNSVNNASPDKLYSVKYRTDLDKTKVYWIFKKYSEAETTLSTINQYVETGEVNEMNFWSCFIGNEKLMNNDVIDWVQFEKNINSCASIYNIYDLGTFPTAGGGQSGSGGSQSALTYTLTPNPAVSNIDVNITMNSDANVSITVFDKFGNIVVPNQNLGLLTTGTQSTTQINLSGLTADTYNMVVYADGVPNTQHFIKLTE